MKIGIYGGSFNPPHKGHLQAAKAAVTSLGLDRLLLIPARIAPHKLALPEGSPTPEQRLEMLCLAARSLEKTEVSDLELRREGPSYTYETVQALHRLYPDDELVLLMGTDMFLTFLQWRHPEEILRYAHLGVFYRGEDGEISDIDAEKAALEAQGVRVELVKNPVVPVSSTDLRRMLTFRCASPLLPDGVGDYIAAHGLYDTDRDDRNLPMDRLEAEVIRLLKPSRVAHVLGCRDTAVALARRWGADQTDAARAGLLHDITKALDGPLQLTLCREYGTILDDFSACNPKTLHALTGSLVAERIFGENPAVVSAIRCHTTGKPAMNTLEKILYVADYMEPNRSFPGVERLRALAFSDLDGALKLGLTMTLALLTSQHRQLSPESAEALAYLTGKTPERKIEC